VENNMKREKKKIKSELPDGTKISEIELLVPEKPFEIDCLLYMLHQKIEEAGFQRFGNDPLNENVNKMWIELTGINYHKNGLFVYRPKDDESVFLFVNASREGYENFGHFIDFGCIINGKHNWLGEFSNLLDAMMKASGENREIKCGRFELTDEAKRLFDDLFDEESGDKE
jgi:hypothetical protein